MPGGPRGADGRQPVRPALAGARSALGAVVEVEACVRALAGRRAAGPPPARRPHGPGPRARRRPGRRGAPEAVERRDRGRAPGSTCSSTCRWRWRPASRTSARVTLDALERRALHAAAGVIVHQPLGGRGPRRTARGDRGRRRPARAPTPAPPARGSTPAAAAAPRLGDPAQGPARRRRRAGEVRDLSWTARLVGLARRRPGLRRPGARRDRRARALRPGRGDRAARAGAALDCGVGRRRPAGAALARRDLGAWSSPRRSRAESPRWSAEGTGAQEALGAAGDGALPGAVVPAGDPAALAAALGRLLTDEEAKPRARTAAAARRAALTGWATTGRRVLRAVGCAGESATGVVL